MWEGIGVGCTVAVLNGLVAWLLLRRAFARGGPLFMQIFLGSMAGRLILVGAVSFLLLQFTDIHRTAYAGSLMAGYLIFLVAEVAYVQYRAARR